MSRILFGIIAALILIAIAYFTVKMYSVGFRFNGINTKLTFFTFLLIPFIFFASILTTRSLSLGIGPWLYTAIQILAGLAFYIALGAIVLGIMFLTGMLTHTSIPMSVSFAVLILSFTLGIVGLIQSRIITTTHYTVTLTGAPESWNDKRAVLVTDTHFGLVNYKKFSEKVVDAILTIKPDVVFHAGDFYDGPMIKTAPITTSWKRLSNTQPVFYAPGNHEMYGNYNAFITSIHDAGVTVLDDKVTIYEGIQIAGITYRGGKENPEADSALKKVTIDQVTPLILINHPPTALDAAAQGGVDLMLSGHTHNGQFWPNNYIAAKVYEVFSYGLNTYKDMQVLTSSGVGTFGPPFRLFNPSELVVIQFKTK